MDMFHVRHLRVDFVEGERRVGHHNADKDLYNALHDHLALVGAEDFWIVDHHLQ